jgi:hypothetical protein
MSRLVKIKGNFEWIQPKEKYLNGVKWVDDPNGKLEIIRIEYNLIERFLIWIGCIKDMRHIGKYIIGIDPFESETKDYDEDISKNNTGHPEGVK